MMSAPSVVSLSGIVLASVTVWLAPAGAAPATGTIPNLSGYWGRDQVGLEQPLSGPGPVRRLRIDNNTVVGDPTSPILKPPAADVVKKRSELQLSGKPFPNPHNQCWPEPTPFTISIQFGVELLQQKDEVVLLYPANHQVRHVRLNAAHFTTAAPSWHGDSIGHYEGETLVIDTVGLKVGPLSMVDGAGTPYSESLHVIERYRLIDGKAAKDAVERNDRFNGVASRTTPFSPYGFAIDPDPAKQGLQVEIFVEDPVMFTTKWSALVTYRPQTGDWPEAVCAEQTQNYFAGAALENLPVANRSDF